MMQTIKGLSAPVAVWVAALLLAGCAGFPTTAEQVGQATPAAPELEIQSWRTEQGAKVMFVPSAGAADARRAPGDGRRQRPATATSPAWPRSPAPCWARAPKG